MPQDTNNTDLGPKQATRGGFADTKWSRVLLAAQPERAQSKEALERLCVIYWQPIYSFLRQKGYKPHDAEDLTQQFFVRILEQGTIARADRSKGRFRSFLLGALGNFLQDETRRNSAKKRGGDQSFLPLDFSKAAHLEPEDTDPSLSPEQVYDRRWAATLLDQAFRRLRAEFEAVDQLQKFDLLKPFLSVTTESRDYKSVAEQLGKTERAVTAAVYRIRQRYHHLVRLEVGETVASGDDVDKELRDLFR